MGKSVSMTDSRVISEHIEHEYRPKQWFNKMSFAVILMIATIVIDAGIIFDFVVQSRISGLPGLLTVGAILIALDLVGPLILVMCKKRLYRSGITPLPIIALGILLFLTLVGLMLWVRISMVPEEITHPDQRGLEAAIALGLLPLATSIPSGLVLWSAYNPLKSEMHECEQSIFSDQTKLIELRAERAKYLIPHKEYMQNLVEEEHGRYLAKMEQIKGVEYDLKAYARRRLAEYLAQPDSASVLASEDFSSPLDAAELLDIPEHLQNISINDKGGF